MGFLQKNYEQDPFHSLGLLVGNKISFLPVARGKELATNKDLRVSFVHHLKNLQKLKNGEKEEGGDE